QARYQAAPQPVGLRGYRRLATTPRQHLCDRTRTVTPPPYVPTMELEVSLLERVRRWESLSRWERSELGRDLRRSGLSYGEIMELVPVKKSTLATWCRDVELTERQIEAIRARSAPLPGYSRDTN